jgi:polyisoprenoid-binding protein YceI
MKTALMTLATALVLMFPAVTIASTWDIDPDHSSVGFKVRHLMISNVKGTFGKVKGTVHVNEGDITKSSVTASIDTASIDTGVGMRDDDLKSPKYLDVTKYPTMTFVSTSVARNGADKLKVTGDLTLHGVTRPVVLDVEGPTAEIKDPKGNIRRGASAATKINRKEFGITAGGIAIGEEIDISIEVELVKTADK